jgi:hypothetical protein
VGTVTSSPYTMAWTDVAQGSYTLTARATDNAGASTTSAPVNVKVTASPTPNVPPVVTLTSPQNGETFVAPAAITLSAMASDSDGTVVRVDYYSGNTLIGSSTTGPSYAFTWTNVSLGSYTLTARATDNAGATTASAAVKIQVRKK